MKAYELLVEYKIEKPAGIISQSLKKAGAATLGALGAKHAAGALKGSADLGDRANAYDTEFQKYLKSKGKDTIDIEYSDLNAFIKQNTLPSPKLPVDGFVADGDLEHIFMDIAKLSAKGATNDTANKPSVSQTVTPASDATTSTPAPTAEPKNQASSKERAFQSLQAFDDYLESGGTYTPAMRQLMISLWKKMGGTKIESKRINKKAV